MSENNNWTLPNLITIGRIFIVPFFAAAFVSQRFGLALTLFLIAGISDGLDGYLARGLMQRSRLGALLDPLADKLLMVTAYLCLGIAALIPGWLAILVISRDFMILGGMTLLHSQGVDVRNQIHPTRLSKFNTFLQILLIVFVLASHSLDFAWPGAVRFLVAAVTASTILSGAHYIIIGLGLFPAEDANRS